MQRSPIILFAIAASLPIAVGTGALFVVPKFSTLLAEFGTELPMSTQFVQATYRWWWLLLPAILFVFVLLWPASRNRPVAAVIFGWLLAGVVAGFAVYAYYAPIFRLAADI